MVLSSQRESTLGNQPKPESHSPAQQKVDGARDQDRVLLADRLLEPSTVTPLITQTSGDKQFSAIILPCNRCDLVATVAHTSAVLHDTFVFSNGLNGNMAFVHIPAQEIFDADTSALLDRTGHGSLRILVTTLLLSHR